MIMPSRSKRLTRSEQGVVDKLTLDASSLIAIRPSFCRISKIIRSIRSNLRINNSLFLGKFHDKKLKHLNYNPKNSEINY